MGAGKLFAEEKRSLAVAPIAIVAAIMVSVGLGGFWYLERASKRPPAGPAPLTGAARAYVKNLRFVADDGVTPEAPKLESNESFLKQTTIEMVGNLLNAGDRTVNSVEVNWVFYEPGSIMPDGRLFQEVIWRERTFVVKKSAPLEPGKARPFHIAFDNIPEGWNQAMPNPVIAAIQFK